MTVKRTSSAVLAALLVSAAGASAAGLKAPRVGKKAPDFSATDSQGLVRKLSDYRGKFVVLEWTNHGCPFVGKHYDSGNMQKLQKTYTAKGVVWLSVLSSAEGNQGYSTPDEANADVKELGAAPTAVLLDSSGKLGRLYGATNTPDMYVINPKGVLIYEGAIDSIRSTDVDDIPAAKNYVAEALDAAMAGKAVKVSQTRPYGCSVKY